ncbi:MAG TPA: tetratricopeptide repeat protein, partial [Bacteroidia bacterium]|nr:tetratricopeptide repeat protein [Bacteroidia bacterium]
MNAKPNHLNDSIKSISKNISDSTYITLSDKITSDFLNNNQPEQALRFIEDQLKQFNHTSKRCHQLLKLQAKVNYRIKNYTMANALADSLLKLKPDTFQIIDAYRIKGQVCFRVDDYLNAIENFLKARNLILKSSNKNGLDDVLGNLASCYQTIGLLPTALTFAQEALAISRQANDTASMCNAYLNLGNINKDIVEWDEAEINYLAGLALAKQFTDKQVLVYLYSALGTIERTKGNTTTALQYQLNALSEAQFISNNHLIAGVLNNIANTLLDAGKTAEAKAYFVKANSLAKETADNRNLALTNISLGFLATEEKHFELSNNYLLDALTYSKQINNLEYISQAMIGMYDNYKAMNKPAQALYYYEM